jgi:hypothetical protein
MMLTALFDGLKLAMLPLNANVGVFHLMASVTWLSAARDRELPVSELGAGAGVSQPAASLHLIVLREGVRG